MGHTIKNVCVVHQNIKIDFWLGCMVFASKQLSRSLNIGHQLKFIENCCEFRAKTPDCLV